jgi:hypothetical protein
MRKREWTRDDRAKLRKMATRKSARIIAAYLRRSEGATRQKACELGISLESRRWRHRPEPIL